METAQADRKLERKTINPDDFNIPSAPGFAERIKNSIDRRVTEFKVYKQTFFDRGGAKLSGSLAERYNTQLVALNIALRDEQQRLRDKDSELRNLNRGESLLGSAVRTLGFGNYVAGLRAARIDEEKTDIKNRINKIESQIADKSKKHESAQATKAGYQVEIAEKVAELTEPLETKRIQAELEINTVNTKIREYEDMVTKIEKQLLELRAKMHSAEQALRTRNMSRDDAKILETLQNKLHSQIEDLNDERSDARKILSGSRRHRTRIEAAHRSLTGGKESLRARYDQEVEEVESPKTSPETEEILQKAKEYAGEVEQAETNETAPNNEQEVGAGESGTEQAQSRPEEKQDANSTDSDTSEKKWEDYPWGRWVPKTETYKPHAPKVEPQKGIWSWILRKIGLKK